MSQFGSCQTNTMHTLNWFSQTILKAFMLLSFWLLTTSINRLSIHVILHRIIVGPIVFEFGVHCTCEVKASLHYIHYIWGKHLMFTCFLSNKWWCIKTSNVNNPYNSTFCKKYTRCQYDVNRIKKVYILIVLPHPWQFLYYSVTHFKH